MHTVYTCPGQKKRQCTGRGWVDVYRIQPDPVYLDIGCRKTHSGTEEVLFVRFFHTNQACFNPFRSLFRKMQIPVNIFQIYVIHY